MSVAVLIPVLGRPRRVKPTIRGFGATTPSARLLFLPDPDDRREIRALEAAGADYVPVKGGYAAKIHRGVELTDEPLIFSGADDLKPKPGWFDEAERQIAAGAQVVGVNDLLKRRRKHATHFLMTRAYAELPTIDGGPGPFHEGYDHSFVDDELIETAKQRGVYVYAEDAHVEHLHPSNRKAPDDPTYRRGRARFAGDRRLFHRRSRLWT